MIEKDNTGFELGFDMRRFGQRLSKNLPQSVVQGWQTADIKYVKYCESPDRATLRWLQLRRNAFQRSVYFDPAVTVDYLNLLGADFCPVTKRTMTTATGNDTDGSVDRVLNTHGYVVGNLVMMSVRANKAKGSLSLQAIQDIVETGKNQGMLRAVEWEVLKYIVTVAHEAFNNNRRVYLHGEPHIAGLPYGLGADVQAAITSLAGLKSSYKHANLLLDTFMNMLMSYCTRQSSKKHCRRLALELIKHRETNSDRLNWNFWAGKKQLRLFTLFWESLLENDKVSISDYLKRLRSTGNVRNTPSKDLYKELCQHELMTPPNTTI